MSDKGILVGREVVLEPDLLTWAKAFESSHCVIKQTELPDGVKVSTAFLGLDHGFGGKPRWFETMIFGGPGDGYQERYSTIDEAELGHEAAVALAQIPRA